jgi:CubicO group peptidase (beta-lactamase class C family)
MAESPESIGIDGHKLEELLLRVRKEVDEGLLPSAQIAIARNGKLAAFETFGNGDNTSLYCIFSATKAITSAAAWLLIQHRQLDLTERVADIVDGFGENGKQHISVEQLFTHTAGFPSAPFRPTDWADTQKRNDRFRSWTLNWEPGSRFEYHPTSSMWVIADIIERRSGKTYREFIRQEIAEPLGLEDMWVGLPAEQHHRAMAVEHVGSTLTAEDYANLGLPEPPVTEVTEEALTSFNLPEIREVGVPGGGGIMSAAEIALFYQALVNHGVSMSGQQIWTPETLKFATKIRTGDLTDLLYHKPCNRSLGLIVSGGEDRNYRGFGHTNSPSAFGHGGAGGQIGWADPETGISIGYCTNGHDRNPLRQGRRGVSISNRAAVCALAR